MTTNPQFPANSTQHGRNPPGPRGHFLFGIARESRTDLLGVGLGMHREYGEVVRYRFLSRYGYQINHPDYIKHVLQDNNRNYTKNKAAINRLDQLVGNGLLLSEGDFWRRQRRMAQPAFYRQRIEGFSASMVRAAEAMLARWDQDDRQVMDGAEEMMQVALQVVGKTLFSMDLVGHASEVGKAFGAVSDELDYPVYYVLYSPSRPSPYGCATGCG